MKLAALTAEDGLSRMFVRLVDLGTQHSLTFSGVSTIGRLIPFANGGGPPPPGNCQCRDFGEVIINNCNTAGGYVPWCDLDRCNNQGNCPCYCLTQ